MPRPMEQQPCVDKMQGWFELNGHLTDLPSATNVTSESRPACWKYVWVYLDSTTFVFFFHLFSNLKEVLVDVLTGGGELFLLRCGQQFVNVIHASSLLKIQVTKLTLFLNSSDWSKTKLWLTSCTLPENCLKEDSVGHLDVIFHLSSSFGSHNIVLVPIIFP